MSVRVPVAEGNSRLSSVQTLLAYSTTVSSAGCKFTIVKGVNSTNLLSRRVPKDHVQRSIVGRAVVDKDKLIETKTDKLARSIAISLYISLALINITASQVSSINNYPTSLLKPRISIRLYFYVSHCVSVFWRL